MTTSDSIALVETTIEEIVEQWAKLTKTKQIGIVSEPPRSLISVDESGIVVKVILTLKFCGILHLLNE